MPKNQKLIIKIKKPAPTFEFMALALLVQTRILSFCYPVALLQISKWFYNRFLANTSDESKDLWAHWIARDCTLYFPGEMPLLEIPSTIVYSGPAHQEILDLFNQMQFQSRIYLNQF